MSGPKCTQAQLNAQREAEFRARQAEERAQREQAERARLAALQQKADDKIAALSSATKAADADFLNTWTNRAFAQLLQELATLTGKRDPEKMDREAGALRTRFDALKLQADDAYTRDQRRRVVIGAIRAALLESGYSVVVDLADPAKPLGDVLLQAQYPSGKKVVMQVDLDTNNIRMNLDDDRITGSSSGADCAKDLMSIIAALEPKGVEMKRTDAGAESSGPKPPKPAQAKLPAVSTRRHG